MKHLFLYFGALLICACNQKKEATLPPSRGTFGYDLDFLKKHHADLVLLSDETGQSQVVVLPAYQGRVMTSTANGLAGASFGWVNHELIASGKPAEHIHVFGGEERFWLGPEGGQYSIFFKKGVPFNFDNWFVPKELDTEPFKLVSSTKNEARFEQTIHLENYSGTVFDLSVQRNIRLLDQTALKNALGVEIPASVQSVGFESENILKNIGTAAWEKEKGLLSIWVLSMLNATPATTVAIPYRQGDETTLGKIVTDDYFGKVPSERLKAENGLILFNADGQKRSKIGISPARALPVAAAWDAQNGVLTIAQFSLPEGATDYVNSLWEMQKNPFGGDAVNSYNDGPNDTGKQLGAFYELESSSPAAALKPGESLTHMHRTIHLQGNAADLQAVAMKMLGVGLEVIKL
ncbi:MAG: hypothetical protein JNJ57_21515 [Saprospiraceae bacterium]|nr:hypothetical protein [Saprospiraceae bacterium]